MEIVRWFNSTLARARSRDTEYERKAQKYQRKPPTHNPPRGPLPAFGEIKRRSSFSSRQVKNGKTRQMIWTASLEGRTAQGGNKRAAIAGLRRMLRGKSRVAQD